MTNFSIPITADPSNWKQYSCHLCGKEFYRRIKEAEKSVSAFCSFACARKGAYRKPGVLVRIMCANCGKTFWKAPCWAKVAVNCSRKCMAESYHRRSVSLAQKERADLAIGSSAMNLSDFDRGWVVGFFDAEGHVRQRLGEGLEINACNSDKSLIEACASLLLDAGILASVYSDKIRPGRKQRHVVMISNIVAVARFEFFFGFLCKRKSDTLCTIVGDDTEQRSNAEFMWVSSNFRRGWITGFFEGDGSASIVTINGSRYGRIGFYSTDEDIADRVVSALEMALVKYSRMLRVKNNPAWKPCHFILAQQPSSLRTLCASMQPKSAIKSKQVSSILSLPLTRSIGRMTADEVRAIRREYLSNHNIQSIAESHSRSYMAVYRIVTHKSWCNLA